VDSTIMGYVYDHMTDRSLTLKVSPRPSVAGGQVVASVVAANATRRAGVLTFVSDAAPPPEARRLINAMALGVGDYVVRLRLEGVKVPVRQNTGVHVFLGPGITVDSPISAPGYVGSFTFFEGQQKGGSAEPHHGALNMLLNASDALRRLYGDASVPEGAGVAVSLITRPLYTGVSAFGRIEEIQPDRVQLDVVNLSA
jgi:hypothetical protein